MMDLLTRNMRSLFKDKEFKGLLVIVVAILLTGTIFYSQVEHWRFLDSLYFSITTLTTVGLGDFVPHTDASKIFTIFYIFLGIGVILGFVSIIAKHTTKNYIDRTEAYVERTEQLIERIVEKALDKRLK